MREGQLRTFNKGNLFEQKERYHFGNKLYYETQNSIKYFISMLQVH